MENTAVKIRFLGTSHGKPEVDRFCSSAIVHVGEKMYMVDAGAPVVALCKRMNILPEAILACFVTHLHGDHSNGLGEFLDYMNYFVKTGPSPKFFLPEAAGVAAITQWVRVIGGGIHRPLDISDYSAGQVYSDPAFSLEARPTRHLADRPAYSFAVTAGDKRILFSGDVKGDLSDFFENARGEHWDAVVLEAAHNKLDEAAEKLCKLDTELLIINHFSPRNTGCFEIMRDTVPFRSVLASDGAVIEI